MLHVLKYKEKEYWDERYAEEDVFEWFHGLEKFQHLLFPKISSPNDKILILGCGNSRMSEGLYQNGYHNIVNIDFSEVVIEKMSYRTRGMEGMTWEVMDILNLEYPDSSFDVVIDKGTIDSLMVDQGDPWDPKEKALGDCKTALKEASRVTKPGGLFISITFSQPHFRGRVMADERFDWSVAHSTFGEGFEYFFYTATKGQELAAGLDYSYVELYGSKKRFEKDPIIYFEDSDDDDNFIKNIKL